MDKILLTVRNSPNFGLENLVCPGGYRIQGFQVGNAQNFCHSVIYLQCTKVQKFTIGITQNSEY